MRIGLTYDLKDDYLALGFSEEDAAEFDRLDTIDALDETITGHGHTVERIGHVKHLAAALVAGRRWDLVFNICEGVHGIGREAQVPALLDAYAIPYTFSDPLVLALTLDKAMTKRVVRDLGIATPAFALVETMDDARHVDLPFPLFAKPYAEGTGKGIGGFSKVMDQAALVETCARLLERYKQPVLVERYLPGREFTVGIVGTGRKARAIGALEVCFGDNADATAYGYENKAYYEDLVTYRLETGSLADLCMAVALGAWRGLNCRDAGRVDLRLDEQGVPNFIEVNPLAGIHPTISDLPILCSKVGMTYKELIGEILVSAGERIT